MASSSSALRIALVVEATFAGVGRHVQDLATELVSRSHDVHLVWSPVRSDRSFLDFAAAPPQGLSLHELPMARSPGPTDLEAVRKTRQLFKRLSPLDVVHGHSSKGGAIARLAALRLAPAVATPHAIVTSDQSLTRAKKSLFAMAELILCWLGQAVVAVSSDEAEEIHRLGVPRSRIHVIPNGIRPLDPSERVAARARLGLTGDTPAVGFVGRLVPQKDPVLAVRAFGRLADRESKLIVVGDGALRDEVEAVVRDAGLEDRVMLLGELPARRFMPAFDALIISSRYEALPYVAIEAMSAGVPVVATQTGGVEELLGSGAGLVVPVGDELGLTNALSRFIDDRAASAQAGEVGTCISKRYGLDAMVQATEDLYFALAGNRRPEPSAQ